MVLLNHWYLSGCYFPTDSYFYQTLLTSDSFLNSVEFCLLLGIQLIQINVVIWAFLSEKIPFLALRFQLTTLSEFTKLGEFQIPRDRVIPVNPVLVSRDIRSRDASSFLGLMGVLVAFLCVKYDPVLAQVALPNNALCTNHLPLVVWLMLLSNIISTWYRVFIWISELLLQSGLKQVFSEPHPNYFHNKLLSKQYINSDVPTS